MTEISLYSHYAAISLYGLAFVFAIAGIYSGAFARWGARAALAALLVQLGLLFARWNAMGFLPVTGLFSSLHFLTIWMVAITLYLVWRYYALPILPGVLALTLMALWKAGDGVMAIAPLTPALDTPLFFLHVAPSFASYGLFGVAAVISAYRLFGVSASEWGHERRMIDEAIYIGYIFLSWCMIAGSLWAYLAWGSYFTWRVKGLWTTLLWFYYSAVVHVRNRGRWQGRPLDAMVIVGFLLVLFTFLGLSLIFEENSHPLR